MELVRTGIQGLDEVFHGGILPGNVLLVEGTPGAGKTTLGLQFIYLGALLYRQPGIIVTFEEEPEKLYRDALAFGWDLRELERGNLLRVIPSSPEAVREMLEQPESGFARLSRGLGTGRIMVDSVTHFRRITENSQQLRVLLGKFLTGLMRLTRSAVLIKEIESSEGEGANLEEYLTDTVIRLSCDRQRQHRRERFLEVIKSRGQRHLAGRHTMRFTDTGLEVYPVCSAVHELAPAPAEEGELLGGLPAVQSTGVKGLDQMCRGGLPGASSTVIAGSSGTGKSMLACQFLEAGLKARQQALLLALDQPAGRALESGPGGGLARHLRSGLLDCCAHSLLSLSVNELLHDLRLRLDRDRPQRVAVDGLTHLMQAIDDESYLADYLGALLRLFSLYGVTSVFTLEVDKMFGSFEIDSRRTLGLFDNLILLRYVELDGEIRRAIALLKLRGGDHDKAIQEYVISAAGIEVRTKFEGRVDVMGGTGAGRPETIELKDILTDTTRWAEATRRLRRRQEENR